MHVNDANSKNYLLLNPKGLEQEASVTKGPVAFGCCCWGIDTRALGRSSLGPQPQDSHKARGPSPLIVALK